jgi:hypothetical protein
MRILNSDTNTALQAVVLYLELNELQEVLGLLEGLAQNPSEQHVHLSDAKFQKEITIAVYTASNLDTFDERSRRLIVEDE